VLSLAEHHEDLTLRPLTVADQSRVAAFVDGLPADSRPLRYFSSQRPERMAAFWSDPAQGTDRYGLVATTPDGEIVAHAAYARLYGPRAELSLALAPGADHVALANELIAELARVASENGIRSFLACGPGSSAYHVAPFVNGARRDRDVDGWAVIEFPTALRVSARDTRDALADGVGSLLLELVSE
jgi:L-amino acid N-acyltransferase YncA